MRLAIMSRHRARNMASFRFIFSFFSLFLSFFLFLRFFSTPISSYACTSCSCVCGWRCRCHMQMSPRGTLFYYWTPTPAACRPRPDLANKAVPCPKEAIINQKQHFCHPKSESAVQVCVPESVCQCVYIVWVCVSFLVCFSVSFYD